MAGATLAGVKLPGIDSSGAFSNTTVKPAVITVSGYGATPYALTSLPPTSGSFTVGAGTITVGPVNYIAQYSSQVHGTVTWWINQNTWTISVNSSQVPGQTLTAPLPSRHAQSFWGIVGIVIGVIVTAVAIPALFSAAAAAAAVTGGAMLTSDLVYALIGFGGGVAALAAGTLDQSGCDPYCQTGPVIFEPSFTVGGPEDAPLMM